MPSVTNQEIAAAFDELDGAVQYRVIAYRTAAKNVREASRSVAGPEGRALALRGHICSTPTP